MKASFLSLLISLTAWSFFATSASGATPPWEEAAQVYGATMKLYSLNKWEDAQNALEGFIDYFPTNENIPLAYLQLAHCKSALQDTEGVNKTLTTLLKKFPDSYAAQFAWGYQFDEKYNAALKAFEQAKSLSGKEKEEADKKANVVFNDFIKYFSSMQRETGGLFLSYSGQLDWRRPGDYYYYYFTGRTTWNPYSRTTNYGVRLYPLRGWSYWLGEQHVANKLISLAVDEKTAAALIKAIGPCEKKLKIDLPASWKMLLIKLEEKAKDKEAANKQRDKYLNQFKPSDPFIIELKALLLKDAWDTGKMEEVKKYSNELIDNFAGFSDIYYPFTRWMDYLYNTGDNKEFVRLSKLYMDKNPTGGWRDSIVSKWVSLAERGAVKPTETIAMIDKEIAGAPKNAEFVRKYLFRKIDVLVAAKNKKEATDTLAKVLARGYWSKATFDSAVKLASFDAAFKPLVEKARKDYTIPEEKSDSQVRTLYDDLQYRISQEKVRHMEELAEKMYNQYRTDAYTIKALRDLNYYFFRKSLHANRNKWAGIMASAYPYNPQTQEVVQWQIQAAKATKDFKLLAQYTDIAISRFPGANSYDSWLSDRLSCYDTSNELAQRIAHAKRLLQPRAATGELTAISILGDYECSALKNPTQHCAYWMTRSAQYKGKVAEAFCYLKAVEYGYKIPASKWAWGSIDYKGSARAALELSRQKFSDEWRWKYKFDVANFLSQGGLGVDAAKAAGPLLASNSNVAKFSHIFDMPNFGYACGAAKIADKAMGLISRISSIGKDPYSKLSAKIMVANIQRFSGAGPQAAKSYLSAANFYKRPVQRWQLMMMAVSCPIPAEAKAQLYSKYAKQMSTAQDRVPWLLGNVYSIYKKSNPKKANSIVRQIKKYKASATYGSIVEGQKKEKANSRKRK